MVSKIYVCGQNTWRLIIESDSCAEYQEAPVPRDRALVVRSSSRGKVFVHSFGGFASEQASVTHLVTPMLYLLMHMRLDGAIYF